MIFNFLKHLFLAISYQEQMTFWEDADYDHICFVLSQHAEFDLFSASTLKQQCMNIQVASLGSFLVNQSLFFVIIYCKPSGEARYINFIVFSLTVPVIEHVFYHNYYEHGNRKSLMRLKCMRNRFHT
jgi:hypothetical protein